MYDSVPDKKMCNGEKLIYIMEKNVYFYDVKDKHKHVVLPYSEVARILENSPEFVQRSDIDASIPFLMLRCF